MGTWPMATSPPVNSHSNTQKINKLINVQEAEGTDIVMWRDNIIVSKANSVDDQFHLFVSN